MIDAVVVGARCAGTATAIALARAGRHVVVLDRAVLPSDTVSTHLLFAGGVAELAALGALERVQALGAPRMPVASMEAGGMEVRATGTPHPGGIDYALCVRRAGLDAALAETARAAGADVRDRVRVTGLIRDRGRVAGVRTTRGDLRAPLVVGADGRASRVARELGLLEPHRRHPNQRACAYAYWEDVHAGHRHVAAQYRHGRELGTAFPCDGGLVMVLMMPPVETLPDFDYDAAVAAMPGLRERLAGCRRASRVTTVRDTTSYFRRSAGPGWALPGDAGHFKDPVTAQGIRDALRYGRLLGEAAAPVLDDPRALDRATGAWARRRERECLPVYHWTNWVGRATELDRVERRLYRAGARRPELGRVMLDVFSRTRTPQSALPRVLWLAYGPSSTKCSNVPRSKNGKSPGNEPAPWAPTS